MRIFSFEPVSDWSSRYFSPRHVAFQFLELSVVQDFVQLQRDQMVDLRYARRDHLVGIAPQRHRPFEHLGDEFLDQALCRARARSGR